MLAGSAFNQVAGEQVFTKHLVDGLSVMGNSARDSDRSHQIEVDELFSHVRTAMSAGGGQTPSIKVISGKPDGFSLAPAVFQPDPPRTARVHIVTADGNRLPDANVKLLFSASDREEVTILAVGRTNQDGKATLNYRFGKTRERNGRFEISVTPRGNSHAPVVANIGGFATQPSPTDVKIGLARRIEEFKPTPAKAEPPAIARDRRSVLVPTPAPSAAEPTHGEALSSIVEYIKKNSEIPDLCSFEEYFSDYHVLMKKLKRTNKFRASGTTICFPSTEYWRQNDAFRAEVLRILIARGVIDTALLTTRRSGSFLNRKEPSYNEVKKAAFGMVETMNEDVCGLVYYVTGYKALH